MFSNAFWPEQIRRCTAWGRADFGASSGVWPNGHPTSGVAGFTAAGARQPAKTANVWGSNPSIKFNGTDDGMVSTATTGDVMDADAGIAQLFGKPNGIATDDATSYFNDTLLTDGGGYWGMYLRANAPRFEGMNYDGTADETVWEAITLGQNYSFRWRHYIEGAQGKVRHRINGGDESAAVNTGNTQAVNTALRMAHGYTGSSYFANVDVAGWVFFDVGELAAADERRVTYWGLSYMEGAS